MDALITRPDVKELTEETSQILTGALSFKIATNVTYQLAADELQRIKGAGKRLDALRKSITQPMDAAKKAVMDFFREPEQRLEQAEQQIKTEMLAFVAEQRKKEQEAQREAEAAAAAERERLAIAAAKAAEEGRHDDAVQIAETVSNVVVVPAVVRQAPKVSGISIPKVWKFEIVNAAELPREFLTPDEIKIRKFVQAMKADAKIAGVRVYSEDQISSRAS